MKTKVYLSLFIAVTLFSCNCDKNGSKNNTIAYNFPDVLTIDTANKMIGSYLNSINYQSNDTDLRSISFSAPLLRKYLDSVTNSDSIASIKLIFAHQLSYINAGHGNQYDGLNKSAITLIIAGYKTNGDYVFYPTHLVLDNGMLCPNNCPPGQAGNSLLPTLSPNP